MFSNNLTSDLSFRQTYEPIDSLKGLVFSQKKVIISESLIQNFQNYNFFMDTIIQNSNKRQTILSLNQVLDKKWINGLFEGKYAIFIYEVPLRCKIMALSSQLNHNSRIIHLKDFYLNIEPIISFRRTLPKSVRKRLNFR